MNLNRIISIFIIFSLFVIGCKKESERLGCECSQQLWRELRGEKAGWYETEGMSKVSW